MVNIMHFFISNLASCAPRVSRLYLIVFSVLFLWSAPSRADVGQDLRVLLQRDAVTIFNVVYSTDPLKEAYAKRDYKPVWVEKKGPTKRAFELIRVFSSSSEDGLVPLDYLGSIPDHWMEADPALLEILFSSVFRQFGRDLSGGRTTAAISEPDIVIKRKDFALTRWLESSVSEGPHKVMLQLRPKHEQYNRLRKILPAYRALAANGGWPQISKGETLKPDMVSPRVAELRANMTARGYNGLTNTDQPNLYDGLVAKAVSHFQARNGLENDAIVGRKSLAALNLSADERVNQIVVNMERWRWLAADLGRRHVLVNQAGFKLQLIDDKKVIDERRVIVGKEFHKTPMFSDKISYLEFNPTWTVPSSIAGNEILPKLRNDPGYLERNDYKIYTSWKSDAPAMSAHSINWSDVSSNRFPYRIVQQPGERNALGRVKFMFPNSFNVYLHDTPSRSLFNRAERALSHGCIRVENPIDFAEILLKSDKAVSRAAINKILSKKALKRVSLKTPVPVHLAYFTVWIDDDGVPAFFDDVYKRDALVAKVFFGTV